MFKIYDGRFEFYQWDLNQKLVVNDGFINEVHFCNKTDDCALVCEVYDLDSLRVVDVPDILLQSAWDIRAYAYLNDHTLIEQRFRVKPRSKPADYIYTETELKTWDELEQRVSTLEDKIDDNTCAISIVSDVSEINDIGVYKIKNSLYSAEYDNKWDGNLETAFEFTGNRQELIDSNLFSTSAPDYWCMDDSSYGYPLVKYHNFLGDSTGGTYLYLDENLEYFRVFMSDVADWQPWEVSIPFTLLVNGIVDLSFVIDLEYSGTTNCPVETTNNFKILQKYLKTNIYKLDIQRYILESELSSIKSQLEELGEIVKNLNNNNEDIDPNSIWNMDMNTPFYYTGQPDDYASLNLNWRCSDIHPDANFDGAVLLKYGSSAGDGSGGVYLVLSYDYTQLIVYATDLGDCCPWENGRVDLTQYSMIDLTEHAYQCQAFNDAEDIYGNFEQVKKYFKKEAE